MVSCFTLGNSEKKKKKAMEEMGLHSIEKSPWVELDEDTDFFLPSPEEGMISAASSSLNSFRWNN